VTTVPPQSAFQTRLSNRVATIPHIKYRGGERNDSKTGSLVSGSTDHAPLSGASRKAVGWGLSARKPSQKLALARGKLSIRNLALRARAAIITPARTR
jgi:hypothetical protein